MANPTASEHESETETLAARLLEAAARIRAGDIVGGCRAAYAAAGERLPDAPRRAIELTMSPTLARAFTALVMLALWSPKLLEEVARTAIAACNTQDWARQTVSRGRTFLEFTLDLAARLGMPPHLLLHELVKLDLERCSVCGEPAHPALTDDANRCERCEPPEACSQPHHDLLLTGTAEAREAALIVCGVCGTVLKDRYGIVPRYGSVEAASAALAAAIASLPQPSDPEPDGNPHSVERLIAEAKRREVLSDLLSKSNPDPDYLNSCPGVRPAADDGRAVDKSEREE
jgi:hypothetical protein